VKKGIWWLDFVKIKDKKMKINTSGVHFSGVCHLTNKLIVIINGALTKDTN